MVRLREIPRTATFAWSPDVASPWIVTGTKSGAVDVDFSNETCLELWDLALNTPNQNHELQPTRSLTTETGFHDLAWTPPTESYSRGLIAGALDNGTLLLWDAAKVIAGETDALVYNKKVHSGAIKTVQYNPHPKFSHFLATGGSKGELFIVDMNNFDADPIRLGSTAARADDIDCLDWNKKVPNILVTGSSGGFVTVWDLKTKKESLTLNNYGRKPVSAVAWDPEKPTRLITAVPSEQEPVILVWDLRNSNAPEKILRGHESGVLSLSWCPQDSDLLLSCGKDNRTILWNPQTAQAYGDYPVVTNWTFQTRWCPKNPSLFATASFDGKLSIQTLQNTNPSAAPQDQTQAADGEDFFSKAQTQPQASSFSLQKAPKWLERPVSVSFGFGGRLISVKPADPGKSRISKISITRFEVDSDVGAATDTFEKAFASGNLDELCTTRAVEAKSEVERADWEVMHTLLSKNPREQLVKYLGFDSTGGLAESLSQTTLEDKATPAKSSQPSQVNGGPAKSHRRFESVFATDADGDFLSQLAATKGTKTYTPFKLFTGDESDADRKITNLVMLGKFEQALDICLAEDRMSDAFMLAICGGESCIKKAQEAYFAKKGSGPNYLRLLASIVGKNLWDTVHNADLDNWKEVMATLCTFADEKEFPDLCEALGDRLEEHISDSTTARKDAAFCYLAGSKLEKVIAIWIDELKKHERESASNAGESSAFSLHAKALQDLIEKVTIFRKVVNFRDDELDKTGDWKLEALYSKYLEYADIVAAHGQLDTAQAYLDLLPLQFPEADIARSRIQQATKRPGAAASATKAAISGAASRQKPLPTAGGFQPLANNFGANALPTPTPFGAPAPITAAAPSIAPAASSYAPPTGYQPTGYQSQRPSNPYAPQGGYQPTQPMNAGIPPPPTQFSGPPHASTLAPPPRMMNQSPSVPPPSQSKNMTNWNDLPEGFGKAPTPRRGTPSVPSTTSQIPGPTNQFIGTSSPPQSSGTPFGSRPSRAVPPPPKAGELPPRVQSPHNTGGDIGRPGSTTGNAYAPPSSISSAPLAAPMQPPIARGMSPYNAPPTTAPPPNRYAPAPGTQTTSTAPPPGRRDIAPPPQASQFSGAGPAPSNPYAPSRPHQQSVSSQYGTSQTPQQNFSAPPQNFAAAPPPPSSSIPAQTSSPRPGTAGSDRNTAASIRRHPRGDRSHIPSEAQPIYEILSAEMSRVEGRAPAAYEKTVVDSRKRLDHLFDHLNNSDLLQPSTVAQMVELSRALQNKDYQQASSIQVDVQVNKSDECGNWMVGVKRLIAMSKATP